MTKPSQWIIALLLATSGAIADEHALTDIWIGDQHYRVEIADNNTTRAQGLMHRTELADDRGMLFVYNKPVKASFWMKNVPIHLNAYWIDRSKRVIGVSRMSPCEKEPCLSYPAPSAIRYVLELNDSAHDIRIGDRLSFKEPFSTKSR